MAETTTRIYELQVKLAADSLAQLKKLQGSAGNIEAQFGRATGAVKNLAASLGAAFSVGALAAFVSRSIDAAAALDDLAEKTGASVEQLSVLQQVARISGTDMAVVEGFIIKLNKALAQSDEEGKTAAAALKAVGINIADLRKLDPGEAMTQIARAFDKFADSGSKSAAIMAVTGKNASEALPFMRDLATEAGIVATVTAKQAAEAEELQKSIRRLTTAAQQFAQGLARDVIPPLQRFFDELKRAREEGEGFVGFLGALKQLSPAVTDLWKAERELVTVTEEMMSTQGELNRAMQKGDTALIAPLQENLARTERRAKELQKLLGVLRGETDAFGTAKPPRIPEADKPLVNFRAPGSGDAAAKEAERQRREREAGNASLVETIELEIERIRVEGLAVNSGKSYTAVLEEQQKILDELTGVSGAKKVAEQTQMLDEAFQAGTITLQMYENALRKVHGITLETATTQTDLQKMLETIADKVDGYAKSISDALVDFATGADNAKQSFEDMTTSVLRNLAKMTTQMLLIEPLMGGFKGWLQSADGPSSWFKASAKGGVYTSPSLSKYSGGIYDTPQPFKFARGGVFAEAGPEAIMPLSRGADGSLGVDASGAGVTVIVVNETPAQVVPTARTDVNGGRIIEVLVKDAVSRGFTSGAFDGVMGATYGLNRQGAR